MGGGGGWVLVEHFVCRAGDYGFRVSYSYYGLNPLKGDNVGEYYRGY